MGFRKRAIQGHLWVGHQRSPLERRVSRRQRFRRPAAPIKILEPPIGHPPDLPNDSPWVGLAEGAPFHIGDSGNQADTNGDQHRYAKGATGNAKDFTVALEVIEILPPS